MSCPPKADNQGLCPAAVPAVPAGVPTTQVNPCSIDGKAPCQPCDSVCVPTLEPAVPDHNPPCPPPRRKKCRYIQPARPKSYAPVSKFAPPCVPMDDYTTYNLSYVPNDLQRPSPIRPDPNLCVGEGRMSDCTVHKMSFQPHCGVPPPCPIIPCEHKLIGEGPMQDITTNRHDYVPKPFLRQSPIKPTENLYPSDCPLSDKTIHRMSFIPNPVTRVDPFRPKPALEMLCGPFEKNTVHKMSYMPWEPQEPVDMPWADKGKYVVPEQRMEGCSVQKMSYKPPGTYIECDDEDAPDCVECPPSCQPARAACL
ncbi:stabilizer of axonemal microtubules 1-like [Agrilus planipennis]|uniref:Stabilizer of axonemal microtubules 1-like n=1 Tax=Agrilus planipennis TaxID=224129 RepID=A0A1W4X5U4_AGRPL|nr:stabilizer of axonemal microtubules 1-like [Agrilus planipennis]